MLIAVDTIPTNATKCAREGRRVILARGEQTGHHHSFGGSGVQLLEAPTGRFLRVTKASALEHQEHTKIDVPPGTYRVVRQREYDDAEEFRQVVD